MLQYLEGSAADVEQTSVAVFRQILVPDCAFKSCCVRSPWKRTLRTEPSEWALRDEEQDPCVANLLNPLKSPQEPMEAGTVRHELDPRWDPARGSPAGINPPHQMQKNLVPFWLCANRGPPAGASRAGTELTSYMAADLADLLTKRRESEDLAARTAQRQQVRK